ncbi:MAG: hypothetical protein FRX49_10740 [Trebouxia sp. A1-2]|nr:MAG: hypothetical protein FRX49_10740 [Trebouxia sp. A1-2]
MSLQADEARAKIINCEALDDKQKAKMLLLINTEPDTTLPVFTGVPDFLLGHTLSMHLEGLKAGASEKFATDRTAQKVAAFQQSSSKLPPALNELERFIFTRLSAKLPVTDSYYNGLVAQNDALKEMIEPVSYSGADILAALIVAALHPEFEGTDEIVIAGQVDTLLYQIWQCMCKFDMDRPFTLSRKRNRADESATLRLKRPDLCITTSRALLFKGEDKTAEADLQKAIEQLGTKMSNWGANFHGKVEYLLCYACAGPILQFCVLPRGSKIPRMLGSEMSMGTQAGRLRIIAVAIQVYQKRVEYSQAWPKKRRLFMTQVYTACKDSAYLIHAMASPKDSPSPETGVVYYAVDLKPLGVPLLSKYSDQRPKNQAELKSLTKCVLSGVQDLHNAGYGHTDIRWQNIIQCGSSYRLIDLEFVCKLKQRPFTPTGYVRKARPDLYSHKWVAEYDLILVGDLLESCKLPDLDGQGQELMRAMQAGNVSAGQALQHPWLTG